MSSSLVKKNVFIFETNILRNINCVLYQNIGIGLMNYDELIPLRFAKARMYLRFDPLMRLKRKTRWKGKQGKSNYYVINIFSTWPVCVLIKF